MKGFRFERLEDRLLFAGFPENFDALTVPNLPSGWTQMTTSTNAWATVSGGSDTGPNHAFVANLPLVSDSHLTSDSFLLAQANGRLNFRHLYDSESDWDGGVLEISVNGGAFNDILTAGGTFVAGGYVSVLFTSGNPVADRAAWNGNSGGYVTTTVDLPFAAYNQNVSLRWRFGSDESVSATGWQIDTVSLSASPAAPTEDFGDAPTAAQSGFASSYPSLLVDNGARHGTRTGFHLGVSKDVESDGLPNPTATGDDVAPLANDDEDGVSFSSDLTIGAVASFNVTLTNTAGATSPFLDAWIDFNRDGDWNDAGEKIFSQVITGNTIVNAVVPVTTLGGNSYARFRLHDGITSLAPSGTSADGEVEDYSLFFVNGQWIDEGPSPTVNGQIRNVQPNNQINGAIQTVVAHPTNPEIFYVGTVNGGIWKTTNGTSMNPSWSPQTDHLNSLAIGALAFDPTDASRNTLVAGTASTSSFAGFGGTRGSVFRTTDGGATWVNPGSLGLTAGNGEYITGIAARGNTIVASSSANGGIFRSTNAGASFTGINSGGIALGDNIHDLVEDPSDLTGNRLYAAVEDEAIYRSNDFGSTWTPVTNAALNAEMNGLITSASNNNIEMAVHPTTGRLFVAILLSGQPRGIFYSDNASSASPTWTRMDLPVLPIGNGVAVTAASNTSPITITSASAHGLGTGQFVVVNGVVGNTAANGIFQITVLNATQFSLDGSVGNAAYVSGGNWTRVVTPNPTSKSVNEKTGGQGRIHFSIVADPTDPDIVYIGGDRQEHPSSIGDNSFNGAIFRGNASITRNPAAVPSPQWDHITHDIVAFDPPAGTANGSAPHADSREMVFDANGNLIETDDGGIYKRTNPRDNTGDWFSLVGDLGVIEIHDVAYDRLSNTLFIGTQDNGTHAQTADNSKTWNFFSGGDGGDVEVDNISLASSNQSIRYSSSQNLGGFRRSVWNAAGSVVSNAFPARAVVSGAPFVPAFRTPIELNAINPTRLILQGGNSTYESLDQGNTLSEVGVGQGTQFVNQNAIAYGGRKNGIDNPDVLWVGSFNSVSVRTAGTGPTAATAAQPAGGSTIHDLVLDPDDWASAFLVDSNQVFATSNTGASWTDITGNLPILGNLIWSVTFIASAMADAVVVGTNLGVFTSLTTALGTWTKLGSSLPNAAVYDLDYDAVDNILVAGTLGRGAWSLSNASSFISDFIAPTITAIIATGSLWIPSFVDGVDGGGVGTGNGFGIALASNAILSNSGIDRIYVQFSEQVVGFNAANFDLLGIVVADYSTISSVSYDVANQRGVIQLSSPIARDKLRIGIASTVTDTAGNALDGDSNGSAGGAFNFRFNILVGDGNSDGSVNGGDLSTFSGAFNTSVGNMNYNSRADWNSDGSVNGGDLSFFAGNFNQSLPNGEPGSLGFSDATESIPLASAVDFLMSGFEYEEIPLTDKVVAAYLDAMLDFREVVKDVINELGLLEDEHESIDESPLDYENEFFQFNDLIA